MLFTTLLLAAAMGADNVDFAERTPYYSDWNTGAAYGIATANGQRVRACERPLNNAIRARCEQRRRRLVQFGIMGSVGVLLYNPSLFSEAPVVLGLDAGLMIAGGVGLLINAKQPTLSSFFSEAELSEQRRQLNAHFGEYGYGNFYIKKRKSLTRLGVEENLSEPLYVVSVGPNAPHNQQGRLSPLDVANQVGDLKTSERIQRLNQKIAHERRRMNAGLWVIGTGVSVAAIAPTVAYLNQTQNGEDWAAFVTLIVVSGPVLALSVPIGLGIYSPSHRRREKLSYQVNTLHAWYTDEEIHQHLQTLNSQPRAQLIPPKERWWTQVNVTPLFTGNALGLVGSF